MECFLEFGDVREDVINYLNENNLNVYGPLENHFESLREILIESKDFSEEKYGEYFDVSPESVYEIVHDMGEDEIEFKDVHPDIIEYVKNHDIFDLEKFCDEIKNHENNLLLLLLKSKDSNSNDLEETGILTDIVMNIIIYDYRLNNNYYSNKTKTNKFK